MAADHSAYYSFRVVGDVACYFLRILARRPQAGSKGCYLLYSLLYRFLHVQHSHVGDWCSSIEPEQGEWRRQRHVGLVLQGRKTQGSVSTRYRLRFDLPASGPCSFLFVLEILLLMYATRIGH